MAADKKILFQICAVPRPPHAVTSPLPLTLFPYNRIPHINGGLVRLTKAYHHKAPFHSSFQLDLWTSHAAPRLVVAARLNGFAFEDDKRHAWSLRASEMYAVSCVGDAVCVCVLMKYILEADNARR